MRLITCTLLLLACQSTWATSTMCIFDPPSTAPIPALEFLGYQEIGPVLIHDRKGPHSLPYGSWKVLDFDEHSARIHFVYLNPGDSSLPDSFTLEGQDRHTNLITGGHTYTGAFRCDF